MALINFLQKRALIIIMVFYFAVATAGLFFNYSLFNTTGDEAPLLSATLKMISDQSLRPNYPSFYHLPLAVYLYLPFFLVFLVLMRLSGLFPNLEAIKQFGQIDFAKFLPLARFITVLAGLACLYLLYKICEKIFNNKFVSLAAVFFLSTSLLFIQASHFARIWLPQIFTVLLAFYFIINLYQAEKAKLKDYLLSGLGVGLAFGTHVVGAFIYASFLAAHYLKHKNEKIKNIIFNKYFWQANLLLAVIYFIIYYLNTYGFSHYLGGVLPNFGKMFSLADPGAVADLAGAPAQRETGSFIKSIIYYLRAFWQYEPLLFLLAIFGSVRLFTKKKDYFIISFSFVAVYFVFISLINMRIARYILPIIPFLAAYAAFGLSWFYEKVKNKKLAAIVMGVLFILLLYPALLWDYKFLLPSSRLEAVDWIYNNLSQNESIINFDAGLELNENRQSLLDIKKYSIFLTKKRAYLLNSSDEAFPKPNYYVFFYPHYEGAPPEILNKKFNYLIISWLDKNNYDYWLGRLKELKLSPENLSLVKRFPANANAGDIGLDLGGNIIKPLRILPKLKQNGPIVDIYRIKL